MKYGTRERIGLLTKKDRELAKHAHEIIKKLTDERRKIKDDGCEPISIYLEKPSELLIINNELNKISRGVSKLESEVDTLIHHVVIDLDIILSSEILRPLINRNIATFNEIAQKLNQLNALEWGKFSSYHKNKRIFMTGSRPQRYWLNENFIEEEKEKRRIISYISLDYVVQGIKKSWVRRYGNKEINVRNTLLHALELEEKTNKALFPREENDAVTIKEIYHRVDEIENLSNPS